MMMWISVMFFSRGWLGRSFENKSIDYTRKLIANQIERVFQSPANQFFCRVDILNVVKGTFNNADQSAVLGLHYLSDGSGWVCPIALCGYEI